MKMLIDMDETLLARATEITGIENASELVSDSLRRLIQREAALQLIALGGSDPDAWVPERRRFPPE